MGYVYQGTHSGTRSHVNTPYGMVFRSFSTYADTVEGSGFTRELSISEYYSKSWTDKLGLLKHACENAPLHQYWSGGHNRMAVNFILSLKVMPEDGTRARLSDTHRNRLAKILDELLRNVSGVAYFRLWVSNSGYKRDEQCRNKAEWITRKLEPYEWAEVICLEAPGSPEFNRPWLVTERLLGAKSSGYWQLDDSDNVILQGPYEGIWYEHRNKVERVRDHVRTCYDPSAPSTDIMKYNCTAIIERLGHLKRNNEGTYVGAYDEVLEGGRYVTNDVVSNSIVAWKNEVDRVFSPQNPGAISNETLDYFQRICNIIRCGPNHWLVRNRQTGQLAVRFDPFGPNKKYVVVPCWSSSSINAASLTDQVRTKYEEVVPDELQNIFGELDAYIEEEYVKFMVLPKITTQTADDRPNRDFGPKLTVDFRNKSMFDAMVLVTLLQVTEMPSWWNYLDELMIATDVEDTLRGDKRSIFRKPYATFVSAAEATLRAQEMKDLGIEIHRNLTDSLAAQCSDAMPLSESNRTQMARWLIIGSAMFGGALSALSFAIGPKLNSDPISVLFAAVSLNTVLPSTFRDKYSPGLSIIEVLMGKLIYDTKGRKSTIQMDEVETLDCLNKLTKAEDMSAFLAPENLCFHKGSSRFTGKLVAQPVEISLLPKRYTKIMSGVGLPIIEGPSGRTVLDLGSSSKYMMHFKDVEDSSSTSGFWNMKKSCKAK